MEVIEDNSTFNSTDDDHYAYVLVFPDTFRFWYFLLFEIISIPSYLIIFIYIFVNKSERQALHNHSILVVLFFGFCLVTFDYTWVLDSMQHNGRPWLQSTILCQIWWFLDYGFYSGCTVGLAWSSFERHILIFHADLVRTTRKKIFIHYLPLAVLLLYLNIFYIYILFFPPCENWYDFTSVMCGSYACYLDISYLSKWDTIAHGIVPTLLITFFNLTLLLRVLWQKRHRRQDWKKCRNMTVQLLSISALFLSIDLSASIILLGQSFGDPYWAVLELSYLFFFATLIHFLLPLICLACMPDKRRKLRTLFARHQSTVTMPLTISQRSRHPPQ